MSQVLRNAPSLNLWDALEPETLGAFLDDRFAPRAVRGAELLASYKRFLQSTTAGIQDDAVAGKASDFAKMLRVEIGAIEDTHHAIKEPVKLAANQIDGMRRKLFEPLSAAKVEVEKRVTAFLRVKEQEARRLATEEAERKERLAQAAMDVLLTNEDSDPEVVEELLEKSEVLHYEAQEAQALAEAKPAELTRMRTAVGTTTSLKDNWEFTGIIDMALVPVHFLLVNEQMVRAAIRGGTREIPGLRIENKPKTVIR